MGLDQILDIEGIILLQKYLFSHTIYAIYLCFLFKGMKAIQEMKIAFVFRRYSF